MVERGKKEQSPLHGVIIPIIIIGRKENRENQRTKREKGDGGETKNKS